MPLPLRLDTASLNDRRTMLSRAIAYVQEQDREFSSDTLNFLTWARAELFLAEAALNLQTGDEPTSGSWPLTFRHPTASALQQSDEILADRILSQA